MSAHRPLLGMALMVGGASANAVKDGLAKLLAPDFPPAQIIWIQFVIALVLFVPFLLRKAGPRALWPRPFGLQLLRAALLVGFLVFFYWSLHFIPLADSTAMMFMAPLVVTALSPLLLAEKVGPRRWTAVVVGFTGVLIILRPEFSGDRLGYFLALASGITLGLFYMTNRRLAGRAAAFDGAVYTVIFSVIVTTPAVPFFWQAVEVHHWLMLAPFAVFAGAGLVMNVSAFVFAPASLVAPLLYPQMVGAIAFGWFVFGNLPDAWTWTGMALIIGAGLYIAWRERQVPTAGPAAT